MADELDAQDNLLRLVLRYLVVIHEVDGSALDRYEFYWLDVEELLVASGFGAVDVDPDNPLKSFVEAMSASEDTVRVLDKLSKWGYIEPRSKTKDVAGVRGAPFVLTQKGYEVGRPETRPWKLLFLYLSSHTSVAVLALTLFGVIGGPITLAQLASDLIEWRGMVSWLVEKWTALTAPVGIVVSYLGGLVGAPSIPKWVAPYVVMGMLLFIVLEHVVSLSDLATSTGKRQLKHSHTRDGLLGLAGLIRRLPKLLVVTVIWPLILASQIVVNAVLLYGYIFVTEDLFKRSPKVAILQPPEKVVYELALYTLPILILAALLIASQFS